MLKESIKLLIFTDQLICCASPTPTLCGLELFEWLQKKSDSEQQIVRLDMCERSPLGLSHTQNRMSGCPQVSEILIMRTGGKRETAGAPSTVNAPGTRVCVLAQKCLCPAQLAQLPCERTVRAHS